MTRMPTHACCGDTMPELLGRLAAPVRNNYFFGKLLDADHFKLEQDYGNAKRWMLNRLTLGKGTLCGLQVGVSRDSRQVVVRPGAAIDGYGREIVVERTSQPIDPRYPIDECGQVAPAPAPPSSIMILSLCYRECPAEPTAVEINDCGPETRCEYGLVQERYSVSLRPVSRRIPPTIGPVFDSKLEAVATAGLPSGLCNRLFGGPLPEATRRKILCEAFKGPCPETDSPCVPLALIRLDDKGLVRAVDDCRVRTTILSNETLLDLILCLGMRVDACCGGKKTKALHYISGNGQLGTSAKVLDAPLKVQVTEAGVPLKDEPVVFDVVDGHGELQRGASTAASFTIKTDANGFAEIQWILGTEGESQLVNATIASGAPSAYQFFAWFREAALAPPVVTYQYPINGGQLVRDQDGPMAAFFGRIWLTGRENLRLTFDRAMNEQRLAKPDPWLRVFMLEPVGERIGIRRRFVEYVRRAQPAEHLPNEDGVTELFTILEVPRSSAGREVRFLVLMRSDRHGLIGDITDEAQDMLLDPEFAGTGLRVKQLDEIWDLEDDLLVSAAASWEQLSLPAPQLPKSGDGTEGGFYYHTWFALP